MSFNFKLIGFEILRIFFAVIKFIYICLTGVCYSGYNAFSMFLFGDSQSSRFYYKVFSKFYIKILF